MIQHCHGNDESDDDDEKAFSVNYKTIEHRSMEKIRTDRYGFQVGMTSTCIHVMLITDTLTNSFTDFSNQSQSILTQ